MRSFHSSVVFPLLFGVDAAASLIFGRLAITDVSAAVFIAGSLSTQ